MIDASEIENVRNIIAVFKYWETDCSGTNFNDGQFSHKKGNKDIVIVKPKYAWVTSHTCRRSFCTNEFLAGTPVDLIMKISGHKSLRDFYKYIIITPEEAGQKLKISGKPGAT